VSSCVCLGRGLFRFVVVAHCSAVDAVAFGAEALETLGSEPKDLFSGFDLRAKKVRFDL
jgi:hypothetical protein